jgi:predicted RNA-binding protein YlqC (UPF0109 family)
MAFGFLKKIFGGDSCCSSAPASRTSSKKGVDLEGFVKFAVTSLVDNPGAVSISTIEDRGMNVIQITCDKSDIGKVIGKNGKTIAAIRTLVSGAVGKGGQRVDVRILE